MLALSPTQIVTTILNKHLPKCAVDLDVTPTHVRYLHPTKGWRKVSFKRLGIKPS